MASLRLAATPKSHATPWNQSLSAPSGHTGLSGSIVKTLQQFFGTDQIAWTDSNNAGLTRSFSTLSRPIDEIVDARVWAGLHLRTADVQGQRIGRHVAGYRQGRYFRPVDDSE